MKKAIQIKENVYWVGVHDFNCRHFHGEMFPIDEGTSYNAYLIVDEKITVIDTVEAEFMDIMLERIHSVIGDRQVDYVIVQHAEPDHSGGFNQFMQAYPDAQPFASNAGVNLMMKQYFKDYGYEKVKTMDTLSIGKGTLTFIEMPLIHWPDNMMTYLDTQEIVFSNDAFGQHIASYDLFDTNRSFSYLKEKAKDYYANIVMPYGTQVEGKLKQVTALNLSISMIAPSHGIIWTTYISQMLEAYMEFATFKKQPKAVIVYESIWHHTQEVAEALAEGFGMEGIDVKVYKYSETSSSIIMKEILDASMVLVGSGCYNNTMAAGIAGFLEKLKSCKIKGKKAIGFGAYGWYAQTVKSINDRLVEAGFTLASDTLINQNYTPMTTDLDHYSEIAVQFAKDIKNSL